MNYIVGVLGQLSRASISTQQANSAEELIILGCNHPQRTDRSWYVNILSHERNEERIKGGNEEGSFKKTRIKDSSSLRCVNMFYDRTCLSSAELELLNPKACVKSKARHIYFGEP